MGKTLKQVEWSLKRSPSTKKSTKFILLKVMSLQIPKVRMLVFLFSCVDLYGKNLSQTSFSSNKLYYELVHII